MAMYGAGALGHATDAGAPRPTLRLIGGFEAASGLYVTITGLLGWRVVGSSGGLAGMLAEALFILSGVVAIVAGVRLYRGARGGRALSLVVQGLQIPVVASSLLQLSFFLLLRCVVGWSAGEPVLRVDLGGEVFGRLGHGTTPFPGSALFGVNLLALALFLALLRTRGAPRPELGDDVG